MELATTLPAELLTLGAPQIGGALGLQRPSAATESDDSAAAGAFAVLLQLMAGQLPAGQPLPETGSDLPPATGALAASATPQSSLATWLESVGELATATTATTATTAATSADAAAAEGAPSTVADALRTALAAAQPSNPDSAAADALQSAAAQSVDPAAAALDGMLPSVDSSTRPRPKTAVTDAASVNAARLAAALDARQGAASDPVIDLPPPLPVGDVAAAQLKTARFDEPTIAVLATTDTTSPTSLLGHGATHGASSTAGPATNVSAPTAPAVPAAPQAPVDTQSPQWREALASRINMLVDHDIGEARIKLNPPDLGALDVKISMHDDKTFVQMTAHSAAARDELAQSLPRLRELLSASGLDLGGATVSGGHDERAARQQGNFNLVRQIGDVSSIDGDMPLRAPRGSSAIDVFA